MVLGWDIGGVNTKAAHVDGGRIVAAATRPFELQRQPDALVELLRDVARAAGSDDRARHAVTMTAELSQMFRSKREGVCFVLDAVERAFPTAGIRVFGTDGRFRLPAEARQQHLLVAAANWTATALLVSQRFGDALLIDVGTTTTDCIPIVDGRVAAAGRTDPDRLASGELVYTGAVRTPVEAIVSAVPYREGTARVSAEGFALSGDVHVWRGSLEPADYTAPPPDGRPATREYCGERLARVVCADVSMLGEDGITRIADAIAAAQVQQVASAIGQVCARHPRIATAVVTGAGAFIGAAAARDAGLDVVSLAAELGADAARCAPAAAVALLLEQEPACST